MGREQDHALVAKFQTVISCERLKSRVYVPKIQIFIA